MAIEDVRFEVLIAANTVDGSHTYTMNLGEEQARQVADIIRKTERTE